MTVSAKPTKSGSETQLKTPEVLRMSGLTPKAEKATIVKINVPNNSAKIIFGRFFGNIESAFFETETLFTTFASAVFADALVDLGFVDARLEDDFFALAFFVAISFFPSFRVNGI
jgi:hypothetical protein